MPSLRDVIDGALETAPVDHWVTVVAADQLIDHILGALLDATGGPDHIVRIKHAAWTIQHPLDERFESGAHGLFDCPVTKHVSGVAPSRDMPGDGSWQVRLTTTVEGNETLEWERVSDG